MLDIAGLKIRIGDLDPEYIDLIVDASNGSLSGSARIYAGLNNLSEFASQIEVFPISPQDERIYELGSPDPNYAGGCCRLRFYCVDAVGHGKLDLVLEADSDSHRREWTAKFSLFPVEAGEIDNFVGSLRELDKAKAGDAVLRIAH
jgi:hypothetical protein